ncbi:MAG: type III pantothenate kinase [Clostridia bacterium]|nr:type III pantothenate kinase [Clostridia bacterium]
MVLAIDIGNSSISCGVFDANRWESDNTPICSFKIASQNLSADEYTILFLQFLQLHAIRISDSFYAKYPAYRSWLSNSTETGILDACVISSVVPSLTETISHTAALICGKTPLLINQGIRTGFEIKVKNPEQLGADIVANIAAALRISQPPFVVLDVGTATTITFVNEKRELTGTVILPGVVVSMEALSHSAALLSDVPLQKPSEILGKNTSESVRSGVIMGHAYSIDGFVRNIREQYCGGEKLGLIATGGLAESILPSCRNKFSYIQNLTLIGAVNLYLHHTQRK